MMAHQETTEKITYRYHAETHIHEYIFQEATRQAVDEWIDRIAQLYRDAFEQGLPDHPLRVLVDLTQVRQQPPLPHAYRQAKEMGKEFETLPPRRFCFLGDSMVFGSMMKVFINMLRKDVQYEFMSSTEREAAIDWLLAE